MDKFNFISDEMFRANLMSDYDELETSLKNNCYKSVLILAGSIIEAVLIDYLISLELENITTEKLLKYDLNNAILKCTELKIISDKAKNLSDVVRDYRNLIHPGKTIRSQINIDGNDASVAKSLVEIIIKEIGEKKQESYGFTAEQILSKIENDTTSEVIWHHLIKKINSQEKRRLLLKIIPERYFQIFNNLEYFDRYPEEDFISMSKFYKTIYNSVSDSVKSEVAKKFISVLHEGSDIEVKHNIESFFIVDYFLYYSDDDKKLVKDHLLGFLENNVYTKITNALKGISKHFTNEEYKMFLTILVNKAVNSNDENETDQAKNLLDNEYQLANDDIKSFTLKFIENKKHLYSFSEIYVKNANDLINYLKNDMPF